MKKQKAEKKPKTPPKEPKKKKKKKKKPKKPKPEKPKVETKEEMEARLKREKEKKLLDILELRKAFWKQINVRMPIVMQNIRLFIQRHMGDHYKKLISKTSYIGYTVTKKPIKLPVLEQKIKMLETYIMPALKQLSENINKQNVEKNQDYLTYFQAFVQEKGFIPEKQLAEYTLIRLEFNDFSQLLNMNTTRRLLIYADFIYYKLIFFDLYLRYWQYNQGMSQQKEIMKNMQWVVTILLITLKFYFKKLKPNPNNQKHFPEYAWYSPADYVFASPDFNLRTSRDEKNPDPLEGLKYIQNLEPVLMKNYDLIKPLGNALIDIIDKFDKLAGTNLQDLQHDYDK